MNVIKNSPVYRSMRLVYDFHGINFQNETNFRDISEMFNAMEILCRNTALHCLRVSNYSISIGKSLRLPIQEIVMLWSAALLHDMGKICISQEILNKPTKLTDGEYEIIKVHSRKGYEIVRQNVKMEELSEIILYHHERYDGKGYPTGKAGQDIPLLSRIIAVADAFDAMTTERPYSTALSLSQAINELERCRQTQFDGSIVECFITLLGSSEKRPNAYNVAFGLI